MSWLVVGIDPGPTPGIVALYDNGKSSVIQCDRHSTRSIVGMLLMLKYERRTLAVERFVLGPRAARSRTPQAGADTRSLIESLRECALMVWDTEFVERSASAVKPWATDARLTATGLLDLTKGMTHARDAARHALFAAVHAGLMPDPLSKKVRGA